MLALHVSQRRYILIFMTSKVTNHVKLSYGALLHQSVVLDVGLICDRLEGCPVSTSCLRHGFGCRPKRPGRENWGRRKGGLRIEEEAGWGAESSRATPDKRSSTRKLRTDRHFSRSVVFWVEICTNFALWSISLPLAWFAICRYFLQNSKFWILMTWRTICETLQKSSKSWKTRCMMRTVPRLISRNL